MVGGPGDAPERPPADLATVLLADPDPNVVAALSASIDADADLVLVGAVAAVTAIAPTVARARPAVAVVALDRWPSDEPTLPVDSVRALARRTRIVLTYDAIDPHEVWRLLHANAMGLVSLAAPAEQVHNAIRQALLGAAYLDPRVQRDLAALIRSGGTGVAPVLTRREKTVLRLVSEGYTNEQIAARIELSMASVRYALESTYRKLGVHDRSAAVARALRRGLIR